MRCEHCKNKVLQKSGDTTRLRIHGPVTFDRDGVARAKCYWCKGEVEVPISLDQGTEVAEERFYLRPPNQRA